jgi:hypothetical protein
LHNYAIRSRMILHLIKYFEMEYKSVNEVIERSC